MRRMISVAMLLWLGAGLPVPAAAQGISGPSLEQALPPGMAMGAQGSGPMTWGGTLSRRLVPGAPEPAAAQLVEAARLPLDSPEDGEILPQAPVVELFTSQGCASCPPADARFAELAMREDVIALALHVDYWDYIGWADAFARPEFTKRQKAYARVAGSKVIYTPQVLIDGVSPMSGNDAERISVTLGAAMGQSDAVRFRLQRQGERRVVSVIPDAPLGEVVVQLVRYVPSRTVDIQRGENAGHRVTYHNIVSDWSVLGHWDGQDKLRLELDLKGEEPAVLLLQRAGYGAVIGAARLP